MYGRRLTCFAISRIATLHIFAATFSANNSGSSRASLEEESTLMIDFAGPSIRMEEGSKMPIMKCILNTCTKS